MADGPHIIFDRSHLAWQQRRAARAIAEAPSADFLVRHVAEDLAERLGYIKRTFGVGLDLGASSGALGRRIRATGAIGQLIEACRTPEAARLCDGPTVIADEEALPFGPASLDLVVSGLSLQLVNDLPGTLHQIRQALRPDGLFLAAMLGGETLAELRQAFVAAETEILGGASPRVAPFADVRDLGGLLQRAGFALPVADSDKLEVGYRSALDLMRDLRAMGASGSLALRARRPLRRDVLMRTSQIYADRFARPDGRIRATFEIVTLTAWAPHASQQQPLRPGSAKARLADALGVPEVGTGDPPVA